VEEWKGGEFQALPNEIWYCSTEEERKKTSCNISGWKHLLAEAESLLWQYRLSVCAIHQEKSMQTSHISTIWNITLAEKYQFFLGQKACP
jgi:hypothetical protein